MTVDGLFTVSERTACLQHARNLAPVLQIRGEIARAYNLLRGGSRTDVNSLIAELVEEREDYLVQAPPPSFGNRRRSAPSPRLQPSVLATHKDFQAWAMAKGVPHAPGGPMPVFSPEVMQQNGLLPSGVAVAAGSSADEQQKLKANGGALSLSSNNSAQAEALARYQQASQALSQANLQQQQAQQVAVQQQQQQQQQILANLHASIAATSGMRGGFRQSAGPGPRRFHEHGYRNNFRQGQTGQYAAQMYGQPQSPTLPDSAHLLHPSSHHAGLGRSTTGSNGQGGLQRPPLLDRRSSWDGSNADRDLRQSYRGSSSVSEAGVSDIGTATAPTSPTMVNGPLPAFARGGQQFGQPQSSSAQSQGGFSPSMSAGAAFGNGDRQGREQRSAGQAAYGRSQSHFSGYNGRGQPNRPPRVQRSHQQQQQQEEGMYSPTTGFPLAAFPSALNYAALNTPQGQQLLLLQQQLAQQHGLQMPLPLPFPVSPVSGHQYQPLPQSFGPPRHQHTRSASVSTVSHPASEAGDFRSPSNGPRMHQMSPPQPVPLMPPQALAGEALQVDGSSVRAQSPQPNGPIRFGNFDAAFYSSEPKDMASLGLYEGVPGIDSPQVISGSSSVSCGTSALLDEASIPDDLPQLPPARPLAVSMNAARAAARFKPELADIPASPAPQGSLAGMPGGGLGSRRPSHTRRRSAGDEKSLGLEDITFFGNIPVQRNQAEREKAMAALLKESSRDFRISESRGGGGTSVHGSSQAESSPRKALPRTGSTSSGSTENETSSVPISVSAVLDSTSSSAASVTSESTSLSEAALPAQQQQAGEESPAPLPPVDIQLIAPTPPLPTPLQQQTEARSLATPTPALAAAGRQSASGGGKAKNPTSPRLPTSPKMGMQQQQQRQTGSTKIKDAGSPVFKPVGAAQTQLQTRSHSEKPRRRTESNT